MQLTDKIFKDVITNLCDGVRLIDMDKNVVYWNRGAEIITGFKAEDVMGKRCNSCLKIMRDKDDMAFCDITCGPEGGFCTSPGEENAFVRHREGFLVPVIMCVFPVRDAQGEIVGTAEMFHDISWKVAALERIEQLSEMTVVDTLTGVGNRRYAEITISSKLEELRRFDMPFGVAYIDIDDFKRVNDSFGHNNGDELLKIISRSLKGCLRSYDTICRMGGDEFLIILSNLKDNESLHNLSRRFLVMAQNSTLHVQGSEVQATISVGATLAQKGESMDDLISRADRMMYLSKADGKNSLNLFNN